MTPSSQAFTLNEPVEALELSNDDTCLVFTVTAKSPYFNTWNFKSSFTDLNLRSHAERIEYDEMNLLNLRSEMEETAKKKSDIKKLIDISRLPNPDADPMESDIPQSNPKEVNNLHITGEYHKFSDQPSSQQQRIDQHKQAKNLKPEDKNSDAMTPEELEEEHKRLREKQKQEKIDRLTIQHETLKADFEKYDHSMLKVQRVLGCNGSSMNSVLWNSKHGYYAHISSNKVVVNFFSEEERQEILESTFLDPISSITLCENCKFLVVTVSASKSEQTAAFSVYDAGSLVLLSSLRIASAKIFHTVKISPCSGYLVAMYTPFDNDYFYIKIYDLQSPNFLVPVAQTALNTELIP